MLLRVDLVTILSEGDGATVCFLCRDFRMFLTQSYRNWKPPSARELSEIKELFLSLKIRPVIAEVGNHSEECYLSCLDEDSKLTRVVVSKEMALVYAQNIEIPIFVPWNTLEKEGVLINKEFIEETLLY